MMMTGITKIDKEEKEEVRMPTVNGECDQKNGDRGHGDDTDLPLPQNNVNSVSSHNDEDTSSALAAATGTTSTAAAFPQHEQEDHTALKNVNNAAVDAAAELIQTIDNAFAELNVSVTSATEDAQEARNNAVAAAQLANQYGAAARDSPSSSPNHQQSPWQDISTFSLEDSFSLTVPEEDDHNHEQGQGQEETALSEGGTHDDNDEALVQDGNVNIQIDNRTNEYQNDPVLKEDNENHKNNQSQLPSPIKAAPQDNNHQQHQHQQNNIQQNDIVQNYHQIQTIPINGHHQNLHSNNVHNNTNHEAIHPTTIHNHPQEQNHTPSALPPSPSPSPSPTANTTNTSTKELQHELQQKVQNLELELHQERQNHILTQKAMSILQSTSEQHERSHAEDVLSLTLEVQRLKEELHKEQQTHEEYKISHAQEVEEITNLRAELNMEREHGKQYDLLMMNYTRAKECVKAAEEDAEQALTLAKQSDEERKEMGELLHNTLNVIEQLRNEKSGGDDDDVVVGFEHYNYNNNGDDQMNEEIACNDLGPQIASPADALPMITEATEEFEETELEQGHNRHNHEQSLIGLTTPKSNKSRTKTVKPRALISTGRDILRRSLDASSHHSTTDDLSECSSTQDDGSCSNSSYYMELYRRTAEKRRKLRETLNQSMERGSPLSGREIIYSSTNGSMNGGNASSSIRDEKICHNVSKILKQSGKSLNLGGHWFTTSSSSSVERRKKRDAINEMDLESMTKAYCKTVEIMISSQRDKVKDLEAFNGYLEEMIGKSQKV